LGSLSLWEVHRAWTWAYGLDSRWEPCLSLKRSHNSRRSIIWAARLAGSLKSRRSGLGLVVARIRGRRVHRPRRMIRLRSRLVRRPGSCVARPVVALADGTIPKTPGGSYGPLPKNDTPPVPANPRVESAYGSRTPLGSSWRPFSSA